MHLLDLLVEDEVEDLHDVPVLLQLLHDANLLHLELEVLLVSRLHDLHGDVLPRLKMLVLVDRREPSFADLLDDLKGFLNDLLVC